MGSFKFQVLSLEFVGFKFEVWDISDFLIDVSVCTKYRDKIVVRRFKSDSVMMDSPVRSSSGSVVDQKSRIVWISEEAGVMRTVDIFSTPYHLAVDIPTSSG